MPLALSVAVDDNTELAFEAPVRGPDASQRRPIRGDVEPIEVVEGGPQIGRHRLPFERSLEAEPRGRGRFVGERAAVDLDPTAGKQDGRPHRREHHGIRSGGLGLRATTRTAGHRQATDHQPQHRSAHAGNHTAPAAKCPLRGS